MSIRVDPNITVYSDCTRCCPRFLRIWFCCCCKVDPEQVEAVDDVARKALERKHPHRSHTKKTTQKK